MSKAAIFGRLRRTARIACAALCAVLIANAVAADPPAAPDPPRWGRFTDIVFRHVTADTGLPFAGATAIAQDRQGFLWIGSQNGLARWDGQRFRLYSSSDPRAGLPDNLIKVLHVDPRGRLWVGTNAGGLARYDAAADGFVAYPEGPNGLSHAGVRAIADDGAGGLWIATSGGLDRLDARGHVVARYRNRPGDARSLPADHVSALLRTARGLLVGTRAGLALLDPRTGHFAAIALPTRAGTDQPGVTALTADRRGRVWIGTAGAGAFVYTPGTQQIAPLRDGGVATAALATQTITAIAQATLNEIWIATGGQGIVIVDTARDQARRIVHDAGVPTSLGDDAPVALFRDRAGALWVGTQRGLSRYDPTRIGLWTLFGGTKRPGAPSSQDVTALAAAADGRIWLGLGSNGVEILDPADGRLTRLPARTRAALPPVAISALAETADRRMFVGTNAGLFLSDRTGTLIAPIGLRRGERPKAVTALLRDGSTLWIGRLDGLWRIDLGGAMSREPVRVRASDRFGDQRVMTITRAPDGTLWIGTQNGLNRLDPTSGAAAPIALNGAAADGLVPSVLIDRRGRLWASVYGRGIALIEQPHRRPLAVRRIGVQQGLPDANVDMLIEDDAGRIWASTDRGLAVIDPVRLTVRALQAADGVAIASYWTGVGTRTATGQLLFGGLGGLTIVDPRRVVAPAGGAPLVATEIRVGGRPVAEAAYNRLAAPGALTLHPDANSLSIEFAALDYATPDRVRYAYRLDGYQNDWIEVDAAHRAIAFTNLPPGRYTLQVRAALPGGGWNPRVLGIGVVVLPAWYQTLWFQLLLAAVVLAVLWAVIQLRTTVLRRQQRELEATVADRTAALRASQRELEQIAYIDVLTGVPNRRRFNDALRACLERADRRGTRAVLMLIDLDRFKAINDTHGHDAGDALLVEVALRLQAAIGEYDSLTRLGGDEFAIIVPDVVRTGRIDQLCRTITTRIAEPVAFNDLAIRSGASIGIALYEPGGATPAELYKAADIALYAAKARRRGSWAWYREEQAAVAHGGG